MGILEEVREKLIITGMYEFVFKLNTVWSTTKVKFQTPAPGFISISVACGGFTVRNLIGGFVPLTGC